MPKPVGPIHISCLAAREQTSAAQITKASPPYNMKYFNLFFGIIFQFYFNFFWLKRPSTSARTVVPLTTPLVISLRQVIGGQMLTCCLLSYYCGSCEVCVVQCVGQSFLLVHHICQQAGCGLRQGPDAIECCAVQLQRCSDRTAASWRWQALILFRCSGRTVAWCC